MNHLLSRTKKDVLTSSSWLGLIINCIVVAAQFWTGFAPVAYGEMTVSERVQNFFSIFLAGASPVHSIHPREFPLTKADQVPSSSSST